MRTYPRKNTYDMVLKKWMPWPIPLEFPTRENRLGKSVELFPQRCMAVEQLIHDGIKKVSQGIVESGSDAMLTIGKKHPGYFIQFMNIGWLDDIVGGAKLKTD